MTKVDFSTSWDKKKIIYQKGKIAILLKSKIQVRKGKGEKKSRNGSRKEADTKNGFHRPCFPGVVFSSHLTLLTPRELRAASCASVTLLEWLVTGTAYAKPVLDGEKRKKQV